MLVAMVIAVRQALDYTRTFRAVGVCVSGWIIQTTILLPQHRALELPGAMIPHRTGL